jgi:hypothetical protein
MKTAKLALAALLLAPLVPLAQAALAHHSYSMFDMQRSVPLQATVTQFKWQNPHAFIQANVQTPEGTEAWSIEMTSPNNLIQSGWRRTTLRTGDRVTIWVHPLRNGSRGGAYAGIRLPDGSTLGEVD